MDIVPFNRPYFVGKEFDYIREAIWNGHIAAAGTFTGKCQEWLERRLGCKKVLLTHSCTAALEVAAMLADLGPGDEVIMPSFTFVSTANAFVLRGAIPVFVDVRPDTLNLDEEAVEAAITPKTRAIVVVHYAGVGCEMDRVTAIASRHGLAVIEDAAQGLLSSYRGRPLGTLGGLGTISFHETKNITCGEGGAILVNDAALAERVEVLCEKGTNRRAFFRGMVDKYTWVDIGSSYLPSEVAAAFLWAQLEQADRLTEDRLRTWARYQDAFLPLEEKGIVRRPVVPAHCVQNGHLYYLLVKDLETRSRVLPELNRRGINAVFHFVPLHSSPAGRRYGRAVGDLRVTQDVSDRLIRLPMWIGMPTDQQDRVIAGVYQVLGEPHLSSTAMPKPVRP